MKGTFRPYVVKAHLETMKLMVLDVRRRYVWHTSRHGTPGRKGENVKKHGRQSIVDSVVCLCTVPEIKKLEKLGDEQRITWTHPLLRAIDGTMEDLDIPTSVGLWGYFQVSFNFVESNDPTIQELDLGTISIPTAKGKASALFNKLAGDLDDLDDIPGNAGGDFSGAAGAFSDAYVDVDGVLGDMTTGEAGWQDLARSLDTLTTAADTFIDAAREVESSLGGMADAIQTAPSLMVEVVRDAVDSAKSAAGTVATFVTQSPSDLFTMMLDAGVAINDANIVALMQDNTITDPFAIPTNVTINIPVGA